MPTPQDSSQPLLAVRDQASFLDFLRDALHWPIDSSVEEVEDITYRWTAAELRAADLDKQLVDGQAQQIANLNNKQPWGIFILEFASVQPFLADRGMTGTLRKVLRGLVPSRRKLDSHPSWKREHLLFICTHQYKHFRVVYFKAPPQGAKTSPLAAFGWGPDIPARTACEFNLPALRWPDDPKNPAAWVSAWADAFSVEKVTKRFYTDYAAHFDKLRQAVTCLDGEEQKMFTQTLLNRLMFLRFIERKGWLKPPGDTDSRDYLRLLYQAGSYRDKSFYAGRLKKLFFQALAIEGKQTSQAVGTVPFLNGGLFEESELDQKVADIPDDAFAPLLGPDGLFYRYNFTVQESTPLDIEVAVDPEMLGKVFEELVTGRHESGSYYTPRPVVSFMCREALKGYLNDTTQLDADAIAKFVDQHDVTGLRLPDARKIIEALDTVRAVDPACGSGAYLLGLLHEIVDLYRALYSDKLKADARELHRIKLDIIQNCLYGVDIDPFATNIAMLRLWLSLTVDSDTPEPLPNLDFKIEIGDSVSGSCDSIGSSLNANLIYRLAEKTVELKNEYITAHGDYKQRLREQIKANRATVRRELEHEQIKDEVDWYAHFTEVFFSPPNGDRQRNGFDIVLANPPYIRQELIKHLKPGLKKVYGPLYSGTADIYVFFYLRALQLLAPGGMLVFISSNKWFRARYGEKLRAHLAKTTSVQSIVDFHDLPVFESAIAYPMIFTAAKHPPTDTHTATLIEPPDLDPPYPDVREVVTKYGHKMPTTALGRDGTWQLATSGTADLLMTMRKAGEKLRDFVDAPVFRGVTTGLNAAFIIDASAKAKILASDPNAKSIIKPFLAGKDVKRWATPQIDQWLLFMRRGVDPKKYRPVIDYLKQWKAELTPRSDGDSPEDKRRKPGKYAWYEIQDEVAYFDLFTKPKIISTKVSVRPTFTLDLRSCFVGNTAYMVPASDDPLFLLGVLNSSCSAFYARNIFVGKQGGWYEVQPTALENFPIPASQPEERKLIGLIVDCLIALHQNSDQPDRDLGARSTLMSGYLERLLNGLIYTLYFRDDLSEVRLFDLFSNEPPPMNILSAEKRSAESIRSYFERLYDSRHPVRAALDKLQTLDFVRVMETEP